MEGFQEDLCTDEEPANNSGFVEDYLMNFFNEGSQDNSCSSTKSSENESLLFDLIKLETRDKVHVGTFMQPSNSSGQKLIDVANSTPGPSTQAQPLPGTSTCNTSHFNILEYWRKRKFSSPRLYRLAMVVLFAPSTQVTVERLFSQVKFILTDSRMRLSDVSIKDIMVLKMNENLLGEVVDLILERNDCLLL